MMMHAACMYVQLISTELLKRKKVTPSRFNWSLLARSLARSIDHTAPYCIYLKVNYSNRFLSHILSVSNIIEMNNA